jgi:hypothetical protein
MKQLYAWSGLGRPISWSLFSHRLVLICMLVAGLAAAAGYVGYFEDHVKGAILFGLRISLAVFLSWAICRELHPDAPWAAFVAVALAAVGLWLWPWPNLLLLFCMLLCLRLVNRSSGIPARWADVLLLLALLGLLVYRGELLAGFLVTGAFWLNGRLPEAQPLHRYLALLAGLGVLLILWLMPSFRPPAYLSISINILIIALATGFALFVRKLKGLQATADADGSPLLLKRLKAAQLLVLLNTTVFSLWYGDALFTALTPIWAAFGASFLYAAFVGNGREPEARQAVNKHTSHEKH